MTSFCESNGPVETDLTYRVTAAVPHWRAPDWCIETVRSLQAQEGVDIRIIVVDNSPEIGFNPPDGVEVRSRDNVGFAGAVNEVLLEWLESDPQETDVFLVACHDCDADPQVVADLASALTMNPTLGIAGPQGNRASGSCWISGAVLVSGTCLALKPACARDVGLFDEMLGTYDEDLDYCLRAWDAGWRAAKIRTGNVRTNGSVSSDRLRRVSKNHVLLAFKRRGAAGAVVESCVQLRRALLSAAGSAVNRGAARQVLLGDARQRSSGVSAAIAAIAADLRSRGTIRGRKLRRPR